jgi:ribosomal protein L11 methyltransferase
VETYLCLRCTIPAELEDEIPVLLASCRLLGTSIEEIDGQRVSLAVYLAATESSTRRHVHQLLRPYADGPVRCESVPAEDWLAGYRARTKAFAVGTGWWIDPHPESPEPAPPGRHRLVVPPGMAFGSGSHESTRLVLEELETLPLANSVVLDVGTGSGILALAAELAGARRVIAVDVDGAAVRVAAETSLLQEWAVMTHFVIGSVDGVATGSFGLVLCNMLSEHLLPLLTDIERALAPGGLVVLSGLMAGEIPVVSDSLLRSSLEVRRERRSGEWASLTVGRRR